MQSVHVQSEQDFWFCEGKADFWCVSFWYGVDASSFFGSMVGSLLVVQLVLLSVYCLLIAFLFWVVCPLSTNWKDCWQPGRLVGDTSVCLAGCLSVGCVHVIFLSPTNFGKANLMIPTANITHVDWIKTFMPFFINADSISTQGLPLSSVLRSLSQDHENPPFAYTTSAVRTCAARKKWRHRSVI